jgi:uncharacterized protein with HEPN domain
MPERSVRIRLIDIREEIAGIRSLTKNATAESFGTDWAMKRAVQHAPLIISEATRYIPDDLKNVRPEVPWKDIHGLGNVLRHEYRRVDSDVLWSIVMEDLTDLDRAAEILLAEEPERDGHGVKYISPT